MTKFNVLVEQDEDGWFVAEVAELPGCYTQAKKKKEVLTRIQEAIRGYLAVAKEQNESLPVHSGEEIGPGLFLRIIKKELNISRETFEQLVKD